MKYCIVQFLLSNNAMDIVYGPYEGVTALRLLDQLQKEEARQASPSLYFTMTALNDVEPMA